MDRNSFSRLGSMEGRSILIKVEPRFPRLLLGVIIDDVKLSTLVVDDCFLFGRESGDAHVCVSESVLDDPFDRLLDCREL